MQDRPAKIIIDTNLWISFLIGLKASPAMRQILTDGSVDIVMTDILEKEIMAVASRPKFQHYFAPEACQRLLSFLRARSLNHEIDSVMNYRSEHMFLFLCLLFAPSQYNEGEECGDDGFLVHN